MHLCECNELVMLIFLFFPISIHIDILITYIAIIDIISILFFSFKQILGSLQNTYSFDVWRNVWRCAHAKFAQQTPHKLARDPLNGSTSEQGGMYSYVKSSIGENRSQNSEMPTILLYGIYSVTDAITQYKHTVPPVFFLDKPLK